MPPYFRVCLFAGETALCRAAENGHAQCIEVLVRAGSDVNHSGILYCTPLVYAAKNGRTAAIQALLMVRFYVPFCEDTIMKQCSMIMHDNTNIFNFM